MRHRHLGAVARRRPGELGGVVGRIVAAEHRLALEQLALAGLEVVVVGGARRDHRGVGVAQLVAVELAVDVRAPWCSWARRRSTNTSVAAVPGPDAQLAQAAGVLFDREEIFAHVEGVDERIVAMRDDVLPLRAVALVAVRAPRRCGSSSPASWCARSSGRWRARPGTHDRARAAGTPGTRSFGSTASAYQRLRSTPCSACGCSRYFSSLVR